MWHLWKTRSSRQDPDFHSPNAPRRVTAVLIMTTDEGAMDLSPEEHEMLALLCMGPLVGDDAAE